MPANTDVPSAIVRQPGALASHPHWTGSHLAVADWRVNDQLVSSDVHVLLVGADPPGIARMRTILGVYGRSSLGNGDAQRPTLGISDISKWQCLAVSSGAAALRLITAG